MQWGRPLRAAQKIFNRVRSISNAYFCLIRNPNLQILFLVLQGLISFLVAQVSSPVGDAKYRFLPTNFHSDLSKREINRHKLNAERQP